VKILICAYDKSSSGISAYTIELAKVVKEIARVDLMCFDAIEEELEGVKSILETKINAPRFAPLLSFMLARTKLKSLKEEYDVVHETLPPYGSLFSNLVTTRWSHLTYSQIAALRTRELSFPEKLGGIPVTLQHYLLDSMSFKKAKYVIRVWSGEFPIPCEIKRIKEYNNQGKINLLFVSRDISMPRKNLKVVVEGLKHVKVPNRFALHIVGGGKIPKYLKRAKIDYFIHGKLPRERVLELMRKVDVLVLPSTYEELGYVGIEAYSVGLPVIVSNILPFRNIFKVSLKFDPKDPLELAKILDGLDHSLLAELGHKTHEYIANERSRLKFKLKLLYEKVSKQ